MTARTVAFPDTQIIVFAREPLAGQVKTRLIPALGKQGATDLYTALLDITIQKLLNNPLADLCLCITPESRLSYFSTRYDKDLFNICQQEGADLGQRMFNALQQSLQHYNKAILIGTDCPFLEPGDIQQAIMTLDSTDMVFTPAKDGGYVLVGAHQPVPDCFEQIDWSTERVMQQTRQKLTSLKIVWHELQEQQDIDTPADLQYLSEHIHQFSQALLPVLDVLKRYS